MQASKPKILVIEDEEDVRELIELHLKRDGLTPEAFEDAEKGLGALKGGTFQLAIVDWMLPGMSGLDLLSWLQREGIKIPVIMVTARADATDIIRGLEAGADDYVTKPFEIPVLLARVRALLRRSERGAQISKEGAGALASKKNPAILQVGRLTLDTQTYEVKGEESDGTVSKINLTPSEFKLLKSLMMSAGRVLSRDQLIELVQGEGVSVIDRAIDTHIFGLRKKLGTYADFVETIRGVGYRMRMD